jgi:hypothetical protein
MLWLRAGWTAVSQSALYTLDGGWSTRRCVPVTICVRSSATLSPSRTWEQTGQVPKAIIRQRRYLSYLLRLWQETGGDEVLWRASLEGPKGGERVGFASLVELFSYLEHETGSRAPGSRSSE